MRCHILPLPNLILSTTPSSHSVAGTRKAQRHKLFTPFFSPPLIKNVNNVYFFSHTYMYTPNTRYICSIFWYTLFFSKKYFVQIRTTFILCVCVCVCVCANQLSLETCIVLFVMCCIYLDNIINIL